MTNGTRNVPTKLAIATAAFVAHVGIRSCSGKAYGTSGLIASSTSWWNG